MSTDTRFYIDIEFGVKASPSGDLELISGIANLKQRLFARLMTAKGSLCHRPNFGVGIATYQGEISSIDTKRKIASDIKEQFELDPQVEKVTSVLIEKNQENDSQFEITYKVDAIGLGEVVSTVDPFQGNFT